MFGPGWGQDTISNYDYDYGDGAAQADAVLFEAGVEAADILVRREGEDLLLLHRNGIDSLRVYYHFGGTDYALAEVRFADGTVWTDSTLRRMSLAGGEVLFGGNEDDDLVGGLRK